MEIQKDNRRNSGAYVGATILIVIGLFALIGNLGGNQYFGESIPLGIGVAFLAAYALTRRFGFLVPGGILTGVGTGLLLSTLAGSSDGGPFTVIGGGVGFLLIFCIDMLVTHQTTRWWPVIPGSLMVVIGAGTTTGNEEVWRQVQVWSPVMLIVLGILLLLTRIRQQKL
jgi:hypothetical protein